MANALSIMIEKRMECGVPDQNQHLFAVPNCLTYYRGHQCLRQLTDECGATWPEDLRSAQLNLKSNELDQLCDCTQTVLPSVRAYHTECKHLQVAPCTGKGKDA